MRRCALLILIRAPSFAQSEPSAVLANVRKAHAHLSAVHVVANQTETTSAKGDALCSWTASVR